jgi:hypothetical protein
LKYSFAIVEPDLTFAVTCTVSLVFKSRKYGIAFRAYSYYKTKNYYKPLDRQY